MNDSNLSIEPNTSRRLLACIEKEGFNLITFSYMLGKWFSDYSLSRLCTTLNTLYIVGTPSSAADAFVNSLLRMFHCVLTAHLNEFNFSDYVPIKDKTKLIYFPALHHEFPFKNPLVNEMLKGRPFNVAYNGEQVEIPEVKCIVRLNNLPRPDHLPTSPKFHLILQFESENEGLSFLGSEIAEYLSIVKELESDRELDCKNEFGVLCSTSWIDPPCITCRQRFDYILSNLTD